MKNGIDKAKLVAFANGELKGKEAEEIALLIAKDAEAAAYVHEVRALSQFAAADLGGEPLPEGKGSAAILKKIAQKEREPERRRGDHQAWLQAGIAATVVVLLFAVSPIRGKFFGQVASMFGKVDAVNEAAKDTDEENKEPRTQPVAKEDSHLAEKDLELLAARKWVRTGVPHCRFSLPAPEAIDKTALIDHDTALERVYVLGSSGASLTFTISTGLQPLVKQGMEEVRVERPFSYYRQLSAEPLGVTYFKVHESIRVPFCKVVALLEGKLSGEAQKFAEGLVEALVQQAAESMDVK